MGRVGDRAHTPRGEPPEAHVAAGDGEHDSHQRVEGAEDDRHGDPRPTALLAHGRYPGPGRSRCGPTPAGALAGALLDSIWRSLHIRSGGVSSVVSATIITTAENTAP